MKTVIHSKQTTPQQEFWRSPAFARLFVGGVGSGKTRAGCVEGMRQPAGSTGMIVAPTYPMLRDATLRTFLDLARRADIIREFYKSENTLILGGGRTVFFRSGDDPDRLRGPNLGWFYLDEAALMDEQVWLIMLGRLREEPRRCWATSTPRGKNWLYKTFVEGDPDNYHVVRASSRTNPFLHPAFVQSLVDAYTPTFADQEIGGIFVDEVLGQLIPDWWVDRLFNLERPHKPAGPRWLTCDLGEGSGRDSTVILVGDDFGILHGEESAWVGPIQAAHLVRQLVGDWDVRQDRVVYDAGGGRGLDIEPYLEQYGITDAIPYRGMKEGGSKFQNRRSKMAWLLRQRLDPERPKPPPPLVYDPDRDHKPSPFDPIIVREYGPQPPFCLPAHKPWWPRLAEELKALYWMHKGKKIALELKEDMVKRIKRSPDVLDALMMSFILQED